MYASKVNLVLQRVLETEYEESKSKPKSQKTKALEVITISMRVVAVLWFPGESWVRMRHLHLLAREVHVAKVRAQHSVSRGAMRHAWVLLLDPVMGKLML